MSDYCEHRFIRPVIFDGDKPYAKCADCGAKVDDVTVTTSNDGQSATMRPDTKTHPQ